MIKQNSDIQRRYATIRGENDQNEGKTA